MFSFQLVLYAIFCLFNFSNSFIKNVNRLLAYSGEDINLSTNLFNGALVEACVPWLGCLATD